MKVNDFSRGLALRLDPTLLAPNEAVQYENIDNASATLKSEKMYSTTSISSAKWFYLFAGKWYSSDIERDYVEYQDKLYYTRAGQVPQKVVNGKVKTLGLTPPAVPVTAVEGPEGVLSGVTMPLPPGDSKSISFSPNGSYMAVAHEASPYITLYRTVGNTATELTGPSILPPGDCTGVAFSPDGKYLAVTSDTSPYLIVYKISGEFYTKIAEPANLPAGVANGVAWSSDNVYLAIAHATSPYITIYKMASDVLTKLANPGTLPTGEAKGVAFSKDTNYLTVAHTTSPFITIYKRSGDTFTKQTNPADLPTGDAKGVDWSSDGVFLAVAHATSPFITIYSRSDDTFTKLADPAELPPANALSVAFSPSYTYLAVGHEASPFVTIYKRNDSNFNALPSPEILPLGPVNGVRFSPNEVYLVTAHDINPFITIYTRTADEFEKFINNVTLQYTYTYYDSSEGIESAPAPLSEELNISAGRSVDLSGFELSSDPEVDIIRLYRLGAGATEPTLLVELPIATETYNDNILTVDAIGTLLNTYENQPPSSSLINLVESNGILFATSGSNLYYSLIGQPDAWPSLNVIPFSRTITGLFPLPDGLVVFMSDRAEILYGTDPAQFRKGKITTEHGCRSHKSCKIIKSLAVWVSDDGICALSGGLIEVLSKPQLGRISLDVVNTMVYDEQYFVLKTDGTILVMDLRYGLAFKTIKFPSAISNIGKFGGEPYAVVDGKVVSLFTGEEAELTYVSPEFTEGDMTVTKMYNNTYISLAGEFKVETFIDGVSVASHTLSGNQIFDITVAAEKQRGSRIQYKIVGTGKVYELEHKVVGRQNGR